MKNALVEKLDKIDAMHEQVLALDDAGREDDSDALYSAMWGVIDEVADTITKSTRGQIDRITARRMVIHKRDKLRAIFAML